MSLAYVFTELECWLMWAVLVMALIILAQRWQIRDMMLTREVREKKTEDRQETEQDWPGMYGH